ncbi:MAG: hypothetical protein AMXMBFR7_04850 [Planctomycetota bacterium]
MPATKPLAAEDAAVDTQAPAIPVGDSAAAQRSAALALHTIVFVSGAALMGIEIAGSRILAPSFGTSIFVWGSLIGLVMGAMALGYWVGGILADTRPSYTVLATIVSLAGVYTFFMIPYMGPWLCEGVARSITSQMTGPIFACTLLFFVPSFMLAIVTPFAVKLSTRQFTKVGGVAGRLFALNTLGSIVGTLATTFLLLPNFHFTNTLQALGVALVAFALFTLIRFKQALSGITREDRHGLALMTLILLGLVEYWAIYPVEPWVSQGQRLMHYEESEYHDIGVTEYVMDEDSGRLLPPYDVVRYLKFNENIESAIFPYWSKYRNAVGYTDLLHLPLIWNAQPKKMLVVGGGGGVAPTQYIQDYASIERVDILELDDAVRRVALEYFQMPKDSPKLNFIIGDARANLARAEGPYDIVILDAYSSGGQIPFHLMTWEFMQEVKAKLAPGGVLVTNIIASIENEASGGERNADLLRAEIKTLQHPKENPLFKQVYIFPRVYNKEGALRGYETETRNIIVIASNEEKPKSRDEIVAAAKHLTQGKNPIVKVDSREYIWHAEHFFDRTFTEAELSEVEPLTDDFAPVETMYRPVKRNETTQRHW